MCLLGGVATLIGNSIIDNSNSTAMGGAIRVEEGHLVMDSNEVRDNNAITYGSAIAVTGGVVDADNDIIAGNTSEWEAIYVSGGTLNARHWTISNNGKYAVTTNGGTAQFSNSVVATHTVAGFWGLNITADHTYSSTAALLAVVELPAPAAFLVTPSSSTLLPLTTTLAPVRPPSTPARMPVCEQIWTATHVHSVMGTMLVLTNMTPAGLLQHQRQPPPRRQVAHQRRQPRRRQPTHQRQPPPRRQVAHQRRRQPTHQRQQLHRRQAAHPRRQLHRRQPTHPRRQLHRPQAAHRHRPPHRRQPAHQRQQLHRRQPGPDCIFRWCFGRRATRTVDWCAFFVVSFASAVWASRLLCVGDATSGHGGFDSHPLPPDAKRRRSM